MAAKSIRNQDGSVTLKTTGKIANTPTVGTGTALTQPTMSKPNPVSSPKVVRVKGRGPAPRTTGTN